MNRFALLLSLLLAATTAQSDNDIWTSLFKGKLEEASNGNSEAQYDVGTMYQNGRGVAADRNQAMEWYRKAAAQNNTRAVSRLKLMEENESRFGKTLAQAEKGDSESLYDLGNMYLMGVGADINPQQAITAFEKAANQGHGKAAYKLGLIYYEGSNLPANPAAAFKWFTMAANDNYPAAQYYLGKLYAEGKGTARNNKLALEWLSKAVDNGFDQARGEMINVTESISMESAAVPTVTAAAAAESKAEPVKTAAKEPAPAPARSAASKPATTTAKPAVEKREDKKAEAKAKQYNLKDLLQGAWSRDKEAVAYLPSAINNCKTEDDKVICLSEDQTRESGSNVIRYKTKAIVDNFSKDGSFTVTYRNLVIDAKPVAGKDVSAPDAADESYEVKTGWGSPHILECSFRKDNSLSCVKNGSIAFSLTSPGTLTAGR